MKPNRDTQLDSRNTINFSCKRIKHDNERYSKNNFISHILYKHRWNMEANIILANMNIIQFIINLQFGPTSRTQSFSGFLKIFARDKAVLNAIQVGTRINQSNNIKSIILSNNNMDISIPSWWSNFIN